ncbi:TonB-dependent receptor [Peristeroidobacter soli]|uniref:TonB-dependent receptor n=1 Tax=Peristeroidobacter soli TaxID=2497877 RepID=UPI00101C259C|nr:TonB-dependent receptor [Peristeroidobacter soli]
MSAHPLRARINKTAAVVLASCAHVSLAQAQVEEVVVTARFKEESLQDVGASIQAMDAAVLAQEGVEDFEDIARRSAGISFIDRGPNQNDVSIRGIANGTAARLADLGSSGPLVSQFLDDIPVAAATASQRDFNYFDFTRVEILRGPQPTLFGEGSVGGTIRYFTNQPDLGAGTFDDMVMKTSISGTEDGGTNYSVSAAASAIVVPEKFGLRGVVNYRKDDGFIDNPRLGLDDVNDYEAKSGRVVALLQPTDAVEVRLMAFVGRDDLGETNAVDPNVAPDRLRYSSPVDGHGSDDFELYTGKLALTLGPLTVSSITGWYERERTDRFYDAQSSAAFGTFTSAPLTGIGVSGATDESFTQEFRLVSDLEGPLNLTAGLYYQDADFATRLVTEAAELPPNTVSGTQTLLIDQGNTVASEQYSAFAELTYEMTDRVRLIGGVRYVSEDITNTSTSSRVAQGTGGSAITPPFIVSDVNTLASTSFGLPLRQTFELKKWLPRVALEVDLSNDHLLYALASTGVRNGNLNPFTSAFQGSAGNLARFETLRSFDEDEVRSYEIGAKTRWLQGDLVVNAAAFHTSYRDPQILTSTPLVLTVNGPDQRIVGLELETNWRATDAIDVYLNTTYQDAEFRGNAVLGNRTLLASLGVPYDLRAGNRPVGVPEWAAAIGLNLRQPVGNRLEAIGHLAYQYVGARHATNQNFPASELDAQSFLNVRVGLQGERWSLQAFVDNALNTLEFQSLAGNNAAVFRNAAGELDFRPTAAAVNRPRTYGVELTLRY